MSTSQSSSTKSYLIRAIFDWCVDNSLTPYVVVLVDERTLVPLQHVRDGQIVLNIAPYATNKLLIDAEAVSCQARFSGKVETIYVPISQVLAIYARENGQGMAFQPGAISGSGMELGGVVEAPEEESVEHLPATAASASEPDDEPPVPPPASKGSHLRRIK
ncbi:MULTISPECIES: ClpXP protease specificity-enhancing factor [unclassified Uliginosibacterium]|uniref:ClpXP protease specificity-enhancing factor n=1 Tax=unclassified Uliginosibacterium TaxID=2621521 RepID=UPI000C79CB27|nr:MULTISPECIES: ClpXP protease specificity-enhancing factor [unclassified Uliginosibacterium]MDO6387350.1 ClpXP protease specificity-enhancing factor [Uliginosibacterium sp. 31-12]PLK47151.1 ClpXP protease specificity-enhancing factor [Uliginosibacterium sp. TH139]